MSLKVGIIGASGAVGAEMIRVLGERKFPLGTLHLFASQRSAGTKVETEHYGTLTIELFSVEAARQMDCVLMAVSGSFAEEHAPQITKMPGGAIVIDNSSAFRYKDDIPLVVPEINGSECSGQMLIANPNCTTAIAAMALYPLHRKYTLKKLIVSTYQAASGAGAPGMAELKKGTQAVLEGKTAENEVFSHPLPFNVIPHIDKFMDNGYTKEEMKVAWETQKIFGCKDIAVSCTAVRIPTFRAHAEALTIETEKPIPYLEARELLKTSPGVEVVDDVANLKYPLPQNATKKDDVEVGRIRQSLVFGENGIDLFVCGDQLLRGAALNAVIIAEIMLKSDSDEGPPPSKKPKAA